MAEQTVEVTIEKHHAGKKISIRQKHHARLHLTKREEKIIKESSDASRDLACLKGDRIWKRRRVAELMKEPGNEEEISTLRSEIKEIQEEIPLQNEVLNEKRNKYCGLADPK